MGDRLKRLACLFVPVFGGNHRFQLVDDLKRWSTAIDDSPRLLVLQGFSPGVGLRRLELPDVHIGQLMVFGETQEPSRPCELRKVCYSLRHDWTFIPILRYMS